MVSRRKFLQLMGGIAALPALGKFASAPKKAAAVKKGIAAAGQSEVQSILPDVIATVMKKGKDFDTGMPRKSHVGKEYKGVKVTETPDEIYVEFTTDNGSSAFANIKKADYVVDEATGKSKYVPPEYEEGQQVYKAFSKDDYVKDVEFEILDSVNDLKKIATEDKVIEPVKRIKKSGGGSVGLPPVYTTNDPKEAIKEMIRMNPILGGTGELLPIYSNENMSIDAFVGSPNSPVDYGIGAITNRGDIMLDQLRSGDKNLRFNFGTTATPNTNFEIGYTEGQGPQFGLQYERRFADGGRAGFLRGGFAKVMKVAEDKGIVKKAESIKKPLTKKLREPIIKQLKSTNVISDNDISRILEQYGLISLAEGGIASGPPPKKGPNSQGLATLFQTR